MGHPAATPGGVTQGPATDDACYEFGHLDPPHRSLYLQAAVRHVAEYGGIRAVLDAGCGGATSARVSSNKGC
jgi:hypothetical protein